MRNPNAMNRLRSYLPAPLLVCALGGAGLVLAQAPSPHLHVDQFGYLPDAEKVAVVSDPQVGYNAAASYTPGATLEVRDATTGAVAFSGAPVPYDGGATHAQSGDRGWWFDFSPVTAVGEYVVYDPSTGAESARFRVSPTVYDPVLYHALRMFYYNRANVAKQAPHAAGGWTDGTSFVGPGQDAEARYVYAQGDPATAKDLTGSWFDAGDYNKYVTFMEVVVHDLLSAYEENPQAFAGSGNIPESGNGIPDVLDEVRVATDWLLKMSNPDGSTHIKMGNVSYATNGESPPGNPLNNAPRYYGPTCTSASLAAAGMLAHAAEVFGSFPAWQAYAQTLATRAAACFAWALPHVQAGTLDLDCDDGTIKAGDADRDADEQIGSAVVAAVYLERVTGDAAYLAFANQYVPAVPPYRDWYWGAYDPHLTTALLAYMQHPGADAATVQRLTTALQGTIDGQEFYGWGERDLYRGHIPDWSHHWGSNQPRARMAFLNLQMHRAGFAHGGGQALPRRAHEQLHYFHGVNPLGLVQLSNMYAAGAERSVNELYHGWFWDGTPFDNALTSTYGPAPGYVTGGANDFYEDLGSHDPNLVPPVGQPAQKSYLDDNNTVHSVTGSDNAIYAVNEPAISYQSAYIRLLANYVGLGAPLPVELLSFDAELAAGGGAVDLAWRVGREDGTDSYALERSPDAASWTELARVAAAGSDRAYANRDEAPLPGVNYYRLAVRDADGGLAYSPIRSVRVGDSSAVGIPPFGKTALAPNPATVQTRLTVELATDISAVRLFDGLGRLARVFPAGGLAADGQLDLSLRGLPSGSYRLELAGAAGERSTLPLLIR